MNKSALLAAVASFAAVPFVLASCARFQPESAAISPSDYTPTGVIESATMKNSAIHYDPAILKVGSTRSQIEAAFGEPNATDATATGQVEDVYAFNPDGTKFVNPKVRPRNIALAFLTAGTSIAVHQARLKLAERNLSVYHVIYNSNNVAESVTEEKKPGANENGVKNEAPAPSPSTHQPPIE